MEGVAGLPYLPIHTRMRIRPNTVHLSTEPRDSASRWADIRHPKLDF